MNKGEEKNWICFECGYENEFNGKGAEPLCRCCGASYRQVQPQVTVVPPATAIPTNIVTPPSAAAKPMTTPEPAVERYNYFDKPEYFVSKEEAERGGKIAVYYRADMLYIEIPPDMPDKYSVRPVSCVRIGDHCTFSQFAKRDVRCYSDALLQKYVQKGYKYRMRQSVKDSLVTMAIQWGFALLMYIVCDFILSWNVPYPFFDFSSIRLAVSSIYSIAYWTWPIFANVCVLISNTKDDLLLSKKVTAELKRRKALPHR